MTVSPRASATSWPGAKASHASPGAAARTSSAPGGSATSAWGYIRLSLFSTAQPLYTRFPIIFSTCFSKVTVGYHPTSAPPPSASNRSGVPAKRFARRRRTAAGSPAVPPAAVAHVPSASSPVHRPPSL
jgi:hypothetical protein